MEKFLTTPSTTTPSKIINCLAGYTACLIWWLIITSLLEGAQSLQIFLIPKPPTIWFSLLTGCIFAPLWEELVFRKGFLGLSTKRTLIPILIISSAIFGWMHGYSPRGIMVQGVFGFIFGCVYLKNDYHYWSVVILHSFWNFTLIVALPYLIG